MSYRVLSPHNSRDHFDLHEQILVSLPITQTTSSNNSNNDNNNNVVSVSAMLLDKKAKPSKYSEVVFFYKHFVQNLVKHYSKQKCVLRYNTDYFFLLIIIIIVIIFQIRSYIKKRSAISLFLVYLVFRDVGGEI